MTDQIQEFALKAGSEIIDYTLDYADDFAESDPADEILTSSWAVITGPIVIDDGTQYGTQTSTVWVSGGGNVGQVSRLRNTITTSGGRQFVRELLVKMVTKLAYREVEDPVTIPIV